METTPPPNSSNPSSDQVPNNAAQSPKQNEVPFCWLGYFDTFSKILAGLAFAAWMVEEWTGTRILLFIAILTGSADVFYLVLHKLIKLRIGIAIGWCLFVIFSWFIYRSNGKPSPISAQFLHWLAFAGIAFLGVSGWILFGLANWKLKRQGVSNGLLRVSDDFEFDAGGGYYIERKTKLRVCPICLRPPINMVVPLHEATGLGQSGEPIPVWACGKCQDTFRYQQDNSWMDFPPN